MDRKEEQLRLYWLRKYSDSVVKKLSQADFTEAEALSYLIEVKNRILEKFPGSERQYRFIYERRFKRILIRRGFALPINDDDVTS